MIKKLSWAAVKKKKRERDPTRGQSQSQASQVYISMHIAISSIPTCYNHMSIFYKHYRIMNE